MAVEVGFAAMQHLRVTAEGPEISQVITKPMADPETDHVARKSAQGTGHPHRPHLQATQTNQRADAKQDEDARNEEADHQQRLDERDKEYQQNGPAGIARDPVQQILCPA